MLLRGALGFLTFVIIAIALFGYTPVPDGLENPYTFQFIMGYWKLYSFLTFLTERITGHQFETKIILEGEPASSRYGDIQVTRDKVGDIPVIIYRPRSTSGLSPALVYFHGNGWGSATADVYDRTVYEYAKCSNSVVFSVDYRRAPEYPFPLPVQDCLDVTRHVLGHGKDFGIDTTKVGVIGDGAGGNLAAAVALKLTQELSTLPALKLQVLHHPYLQALDLRLPSYVDYNDTVPRFSAKRMALNFVQYFGIVQRMREHYATVMTENRHISPLLRNSVYSDYVNVSLLHEKYRKPNKTASVVTRPFDSLVFSKVKQIVTNPLFSPLMSPELVGVPTAFIHVCQYDVFRDDALLYAERLRRSGVKVNVYYGRGGFHSDSVRLLPEFLFPKSGQDAFKAACGFLNSMFK